MSDTRYIPMPPRIRMAVYAGGSENADLLRTSRPVSHGVPEEAARALGDRLGCLTTPVLTDSGTTALHLSAQAMGLGPGDEVVFTTFNCPQVLEGMTATGADPVLVDCDRLSGAADPERVARSITPRTRCIVLTHQFGRVDAGTGAIIELARDRGIQLVDDAAQALGASYNGVPAGRLGDYGITSFGRQKPLNCLGGGALVLPDSAVDGRLPTTTTAAARRGVRRSAFIFRYDMWLRARSTGVQRSVGHFRRPGQLFTDVAEAFESRVPPPPTGAGIDPACALLLRHKLRALDTTMARWSERASLLASLLEGLPVGLPLSGGPDDNRASFTLRVAPEHRFELGRHLSARGIQTSWVHYPLHRFSTYRKYADGPFPGAEDLWQRTLTLPCRGLDTHQLHELGTAVREYFRVARP